MTIKPIRRRVKWRDVQHIIDNLATKIHESGNTYDCIISVNRGGLIVGTCLSYILNIQHGVISVQYKEKQGRAVDTELPPESQMDLGEHISISTDISKIKKVLLFDDSCDTGYLMTHTVNLVKSKILNLERLDTAAIFLQKQSDFIPTYYYEKMDGTQLFVFDWEQF